METKTYNVYKFSELSEKGKQNAVEKLADINIDYEWWDYLYDDAKNIGIEILSFDIYRRGIKGKFIKSISEVLSNIISQHGKTCQTYKTAQQWYKERRNGSLVADEVLYDLLQDYLMMLKNDYEYFTSEESIIETIMINDYDFTEDGEID